MIYYKSYYLTTTKLMNGCTMTRKANNEFEQLLLDMVMVQKIKSSGEICEYINVVLVKMIAEKTIQSKLV